MVKGQRAEMFCTIPNKCMELQGFLDEGLFTKNIIITDYGEGQNSYTPIGEALKVGTPVNPLTGKDRTYEKATTNKFIAVIRADPKGTPPVNSTDKPREALLQFIAPALDYHIPLCDDNQEIQAGDRVGWTGTKWDKIEIHDDGIVLLAKEGASANSGKYIDAYCLQL